MFDTLCHFTLLLFCVHLCVYSLVCFILLILGPKLLASLLRDRGNFVLKSKNNLLPGFRRLFLNLCCYQKWKSMIAMGGGGQLKNLQNIKTKWYNCCLMYFFSFSLQIRPLWFHYQLKYRLTNLEKNIWFHILVVDGRGQIQEYLRWL